MTTSLLWFRWNKLKTQIEELQVAVGDIYTTEPTTTQLQLIKKIRELKDEASVLKLAIEDMNYTKLNNYELIQKMNSNRSFYSRMRGY